MRSTRRLNIIITLVVVLSVASAVALWFQRPVPTNNTLGIASSLVGLSPDELDTRLDGFKAAGVRWVRFDLQWSRVEAAGPGQADWQETDRVVQGLAKRRMEGVAMIGYTPAWARGTQCPDTEMCAPSDPGAYARFAAAAVARYHRTVGYWELWNEPNAKQFFQPAADPARYAALVKAAYPQIKAADPRALVLIGGSAPAATGDGSYLSTDWLQALYAQGTQGYFDAYAHHPYTNPDTPAHANQYDAWGQLTTLHNLMASHGDTTKSIWATEYGFPTNGSGPHVSEQQQAAYLTDAVTRYRQLLWAGPLFWYSYQDASADTTSTEGYYGLTRADGSHKPAYDTFRQALAAARR